MGRNLDSHFLFTLQYIGVFTIEKGNGKVDYHEQRYVVMKENNKPDTGLLIHPKGRRFTLNKLTSKKRRGKHFSNSVPWYVSISPSNVFLGKHGK